MQAWGLERTTGRAATVALAGGLVLVVIAAGSVAALRSAEASNVPAATSVTLREDGAGPTTLSLNWTTSEDIFFSSYTVQSSTTGSDGPWSVIGIITAKSETSAFVYGLPPGSTAWWEVVDTDAASTASSNTLRLSQPDASQITYTLPTPTSVVLNWTNNAYYGGMVAFHSYTLYEKVNGGAASVVAAVPVVTTTSYTVGGLSPSTSYSFSVTTTDQCSACSPLITSASSSNSVGFSTVLPVSASASSSAAYADVSQPIRFSCVAGGGVPPYSYSWQFGDGASGTGGQVAHAYSTFGSETAVCAATDSSGGSAMSTVSVSIDSLPTVSTPTFSPASPGQGDTLTMSVTASGGSGGYGYNWSGLPSGCRTQDSASISCQPSSAGTYEVTVTVTDSNGGAGTSAVASLVVTSAPAGQPAVIGPELLAAGLGAVVIIVGAGVVILVRRSR